MKRPNETDDLIAALRPIMWRYKTPEYHASLTLLKAVRLAPTLEVCEMLCRGEKVPRSRLDPKQAKAYGY